MPDLGAFVSGFISGFKAFFGFNSGSVYVGTGGSSIGAAQAGVTVGTIAAPVVASTAVTMASTAVMMQGMNQEPPPGSLANVLDPMPSSRTIYGQTKTGGVIVFAKATRGYKTVASPGGTTQQVCLLYTSPSPRD